MAINRPPSDEIIPTPNENATNALSASAQFQRNMANWPVNTSQGGNQVNSGATPATTSTVVASPSPTGMNPRPDVDGGSPSEEEAARAAREDQNKRDTVATLMDIMNADDFLPNELSALHLPAYRIKLFMTAQVEVVKKAQINSIAELYKAIDELPQAILAESGVTAGFNISSMNMEEMVSPGFQNRNTGLTTMTMVINEPNGSSFVETLAKSARKLGIANYQQWCYYVEITFNGRTEDGIILPNALAESGLPSGGRWIYQMKITNCDVKMDERGATYTLKLQPHALDAFDDAMVGAVPDNLVLTGGNIGELLDNFGTELTKLYETRYMGKLFNFKFVAKKDPDSDKDIDPNTFRLQQSEEDQINAMTLHTAKSGEGVAVHIPRGTRVSDVIDYIWTSCEDAQKRILDTKSPSELEDRGGTWNDKPYRESVVPRVEADVTITDYDPILNTYYQDIVYNIYAYYTYSPNLSPSQTQKAADPNYNVGGKIAQRLKDRGYLQKAYKYRYTGENTEVINFDLDFNFNFAAVLPRVAGWRADLAGNADGERRAPAHDQKDGIARNEVSTSDTAGGNGSNPAENIAPDPAGNAPRAADSESGYAASASVISSQIAAEDGLKQEIENEKRGTNDPQKIAELESRLKIVVENRERAAKEISEQRRVYSERQREITQRIMDTVGTFYSEDENHATSEWMAYKVRHRIAGDERAQEASGTGVMGHWHRGQSLTGALLNQLYEPHTASLLKIDITIKGDPYWLGLSNLERRAVHHEIVKPSEMYDLVPNFTGGDNTFALMIRFPQTTDSETGKLLFRQDDVYNGLYRCNRIKHSFDESGFTQVLTATKLELAQLPASTLTEDDVIVEQNI